MYRVDEIKRRKKKKKKEERKVNKIRRCHKSHKEAILSLVADVSNLLAAVIFPLSSLFLRLKKHVFYGMRRKKTLS